MTAEGIGFYTYAFFYILQEENSNRASMKSSVFKLLSLIILFTCVQSALSQSWRSEVRLLLNEGIAQAKESPETAIQSVLEAFEIAKAQKDNWTISNVKSTMGYISNIQRDYSAAFINYTEALEFLNKADTTDYANLMAIHENLALIHKKYKSYDQSIFHYLEAANTAITYSENFPGLMEKRGHSKLLIELPYRQALAYRDKGDYKSAGKILIGIWKKSEDDSNVISYAKVLNQLGLIQKRAGDIKEAEYYFGMVIGTKGVKPKMKAIAMHNMGAMFLAAEQYDKAQSYFDRALELKKEHSNNRSQFITYLDMGELAYTTGRIKEAADWWEEGLRIFDKVEGEPDLFEVYNWLQKAYLQLNPEKVLAFNEKYASLNKAWRDEQQKQQAQNSLFALQSEVNALKLEKEEAYAQKQLMKVYLPLAIGVLVTVVALILIIIRIRTVRRARADIKEAEAIMERIK